MRRNIAFSGVLLLLFIGFCVRAQQNAVGKPVVPVAEISKDIDAQHQRLSNTPHHQ